MGYKPKKRNLTTNIYFNEYDTTTSIITCNADLKNRLYIYSKRFPDLCKVIDDNDGCVEFEIIKDRVSYRLLPPCTNTRKETARKLMNIINSKEDVENDQ